MRSRRNIYLVIGIILIVLNLLTDILSLSEYQSGDTTYNIGYFIGSHFFFFAGVVLLRLAYKINKRLKNNSSELHDAIEKIGSKDS